MAAGSLTDAQQVDLLRGLVAIPSTSRNEAEAVAYLCGWMNELGFEAGPDEAGNAVGRIGSGDKTIVLLGHIDTVPGEIPVRIENGELYGRGAVDAKGPLATFVCAAAAAAERANARLIVVGAVGEESIGSPGATQVATWPAPDYCIIGEPSGWDSVCLGYRGTISTNYRLRQGSRHFAGPGESVAEQAVAYWNALNADAARRNEGAAGNFGSIGATLRAMATTSDGLSDEAWMSIGVRIPPALDVDAFIATMHELAGPAELTIEGRQEGYRTDKRSPVVPPFLRSIRAEGGTPRFTLKLGTSDMNVVGPVWNCPIVAYGPGDASLDHTPDERIVLDDYLKAVRVLTEVLVAL
ncbi:MAG: [LysW]-lysine hydrolase [Thermomicrobiales bacterium]|nr:[LysW]-lysine hydrolase [Thermomicrobiales bacterium]